MPRLTFPITTDGLAVDVRVHPDSTTMRTLQRTGQPLASGLKAKGLIDTGTNITALAPSLLQQLGIQAYGHQKPKESADRTRFACSW